MMEMIMMMFNGEDADYIIVMNDINFDFVFKNFKLHEHYTESGIDILKFKELDLISHIGIKDDYYRFFMEVDLLYPQGPLNFSDINTIKADLRLKKMNRIL